MNDRGDRGDVGIIRSPVRASILPDYARDPARFGATTVALAVARDELAVAEEQWLRLEMLREEIEAAESRY